VIADQRLTSAISLHNAGIEAHVYERAFALREIGAGISLWANAIHVLDELGLADAIRRHVLSELHAGLRTWRGTVLAATTSNELTKRFAVPIAVMHRARQPYAIKLLSALAELCRSASPTSQSH
jgi:2-polyprenyl-6-methoxyphenol hydroxylase-like FAD-dependent oxidoreductase